MESITQPQNTCCSKDNCTRAPVTERNGQPLCHMHSPDPKKDVDIFLDEVMRILGAERKKGATIDFTGFHFPNGFRFPSGTKFPYTARFNGATFHDPCNLCNCEFSSGADFTDARFLSGCDFSQTLFDDLAVFRGAEFHGESSFSRTHFNGVGNFCSAAFHGPAHFLGTSFAGPGLFREASFSDSAMFTSCVFDEDCIFKLISGELDFDSLTKERQRHTSIADFRGARFEEPRRVRFSRINRGDIRTLSRGNAEMEDFFGVRFRLMGSRVSEVSFDDINWYTTSGRMTLWDEVDVKARSGLIYNALRRLRRLADLAPIPRTRDYELVAIAYRDLMKTFESASSIELAEDCYVGAMEMNRMDPSRPLFQRMVLTAYRTISNYGSSYRRAFLVLVSILLIFGLAYALPQSGLTDRRTGVPTSPAVNPVARGLLHSIEVGTFQRDTTSISTNGLGRMLAISESILVPSQLALFLLALRRRLKR